MNPARLALLSAEWRQKREALLEAFPELADDPEALVDTLDGAAEALDVVAWLVKSALEAGALANGLRDYREELHDRHTHLVQRNERLRAEAQALMESLGVSKVKRPEFDLSIRPGPKKVHLADTADLPDFFWRHPAPEPDKLKIREALEAGTPVPGATLGNGAAVLTVRIS